MPAARDLSKEKFGRLQPLYPTDKRKNKSIVWMCRCDCGTEKEIPAYFMTGGKVKSCGCLKKETDRQPKGNTIDMLNKKFGHLTVIARDGSDKNGQAKWLCQCDCGNPKQISVLGDNLRRGHTQSCGCERRSHGELKVAQLLSENNIPFEQEVPMFKFANGTNARFDFYVNNQYLIEYDGETHYKYNLHGWHNEEELKAQQERDMIKTQWCKEHNIPLIRIPYTKYETLCIEDLLLREPAEATLD